MSNNVIIFEFRIKYETKDGEDIYILGNNSDFGNWEDKKFKLDYNNGYIWKKEYPMNINNNLIEYKFVCFNKNNNYCEWEKCPNRILDVKNLDNLKKENNKYILDLVWNYFSIIFKLNYHIDIKDSYMVILGAGRFLGDWKEEKKEELKMQLEKHKEKKIEDVWVKQINVFAENNMKEMNFEYKYLVYDYKNNKIKYEKGMNRCFKIIFKIDEDNDELKFFMKTNPKEYKILTNSILEVDDYNCIIK